MSAEAYEWSRAGLGMTLADLTLRAPVVVTPESSIRHAASQMRNEGVSSLLVRAEPASFVTERDITRSVAEGIDPERPVADIATRGPVWVPPTLTVAHAAAVMVHYGLRHLLVVAPTGEAVGVVSIRDAFRVLLEAVDPGGWVSAFDAALRDVG